MTSEHTKINAGTQAGADKAAEHLPALTRVYGRTLRAAGRRAAARFRQIQPTVAAANGEPPNWVPPPTGQLIDQQQLADDVQAKTAKLHRQMLTASASAAMQPFDISFDIRAPTSQAILDAIAARIQGTITSAIEEQITETIQKGYAAGDSVDRVARAITAATDAISRPRADMLARTDLNALSNAGSLLGATTADAASTKTWLATEDERTRETHADADGQTVPINDAFDVGGEQAQYPGDPDLSWEESANCRCSIIYGLPLTASAVQDRDLLEALLLSGDESAIEMVAAAARHSLNDGSVIGLGNQVRLKKSNDKASIFGYRLVAMDGVPVIRDRASAIGLALVDDADSHQVSEAEDEPKVGIYEQNARLKGPESVRSLLGSPDRDSSLSVEESGGIGEPFLSTFNHTPDNSTLFSDGTALGEWRDHLWEGSDLTLVVSPHADAVTSGGDMTTTIDVGKLTKTEREELAATLAEPLSPEMERLVTVRTALSEHGMADAFDDEQLAAIILVSEALSLSPENRPLRASLTNFALLAAAAGGTPWSATLCVAGMPTVDSGIKRLLSVDSGGWLPLPLPLALMDDSPHADLSTKSPICGRIDSISVAGNDYQATGVFFDDSDDPEVAAAGSKAAALVSEMRRMGVSCDLVDCEWEMMVYDASSVTGLAEAIEDAMDDANDPAASDADLPGGPATMDEVIIAIDDDDEVEYIMVAKKWTIGGATIVPIQALTDSTISLVASAFERTAEWRSETQFAPAVLTAAAAGLVPLEPPADWFENPELDGPTPLTVTDEGRVYGHLATWDTCHTGLPGCVPPPRSPTGYMNFHLGEIKTADGGRVAVGTLSFDKGHAGLRSSVDRTIAHYDDTTTAGAHVRAGEDRWGIWLAGALNPRISAEEARVLMAAPPSGDWRQVRKGEGKDLVGALAVNVPGFPVPRERRGLSLQASAADCGCDEALARELLVLAASADGIEGLAELVA